jgi:hypothetical protein
MYPRQPRASGVNNMMKILGIVYCFNSNLFTFSNDCSASKSGFFIKAVPDSVCWDEQAKAYYAKKAIEAFTKRPPNEFTIIKTHCLIP